MDTMPPQTPAQSNNTSAMIGAGIIVVLLAIGAYYFTVNKPTSDTNNDTGTESAAQSDQKTEALKQTSSSDSATAIESDLQATDIGDMQAEMNATSDQI